ncbi:MAG: hypothetical protein HKN22_04210 [Bacteroidia bacterium]|nr:hypothetical protein [Bacteroidia bacterium]
MRWHKTFIYYSKKDRRAIYLLLLILFCVSIIRIQLKASKKITAKEAAELEAIYLEHVERGDSARANNRVSARARANNSVSARARASANNSVSASARASSDESEYKTNLWKPLKFDPNTLADTLWRNFGLSEKQIQVIINYRNKGGKFYKKTDLKKIYSIDEETFNRIEPFIVLESANRSSKQIANSKKRSTLEINTCNISQLMKQYNMQFEEAKAFVNYRNQLGGFQSKEQLRELKEVDPMIIDSLRQTAEIDNRYLRRLNINKLSDKAKYHPYIGKGMARLIENYRLQHGDYQSVEELKKLSIMTDALYIKLQPYLIVE